MKKAVVITLNIEASTLFKIDNPTPEQLDKYCSFTDNNNGKSPNGSNEEYTTEVYIGNSVQWLGFTKEADFKVEIESIAFKPERSDVNFFDTEIVKGSKGTVTASVLNDDRLKGAMYSFLINFSIIHSSQKIKYFSIDPKLSINV